MLMCIINANVHHNSINLIDYQQWPHKNCIAPDGKEKATILNLNWDKTEARAMANVQTWSWLCRSVIVARIEEKYFCSAQETYVLF